MEIIRRLKGMKDLPSSSWTALHQVEDGLRQFLGSYGYQPVATPLLEETELFLRKSGGEMAARLYSFADPGGRRTSLRPEITSSVVRAYIEGSLGQDLPLRLQYAGPVFRYEQDGTYRQFTQVGAELLGAAAVAADAELVALASRSLAHLGVTGHRLVIGHVGTVSALLDSLKLSQRAKVFMLSNLPDLKGGTAGLSAIQRRAIEIGLLREMGSEQSLSRLVRGLPDREAADLIESFLAGATATGTGQRTQEEVVSRYLAKLRGGDDPATIQRALDLAAALAKLEGSPQRVLGEVQAVAKEFRLDPATLAPLQELMDALSSYNLGQVEVVLDMGLVRGIAYYTGFVLEVTHPRASEGRSLGGGGRYDGMVMALGGRKDVPALGFALNAERVAELLAPRPQAQAPVIVVPEGPEAIPAAVAVADSLRRDDLVVELEVAGRSPENVLRAIQGQSRIVVVSKDGTTELQSSPNRRGAKAGRP